MCNLNVNAFWFLFTYAYFIFIKYNLKWKAYEIMNSISD